MLLSLSSLPRRFSRPTEAAEVLIRCYADRIKRWTAERRMLPLRPPSTQQRQRDDSVEAAESGARRAAQCHQQLVGAQQVARQLLLALDVNIARWERYARQYSALRQRMAPLLEVKRSKQRQWQGAAMQVIQRLNGAETNSETKSVTGRDTHPPRRPHNDSLTALRLCGARPCLLSSPPSPVLCGCAVSRGCPLCCASLLRNLRVISIPRRSVR